MQAHANDLRSEIETDWQALTDEPTSTTSFDTFVHQAVDDWAECPLRPAVRLLLEYAVKITRTPMNCEPGDVERLRAVGWTDAALHDAVQVVSYFNYINRVADALGVAPERDLPCWGVTEGKSP